MIAPAPLRRARASHVAPGPDPFWRTIIADLLEQDSDPIPGGGQIDRAVPAHAVQAAGDAGSLFCWQRRRAGKSRRATVLDFDQESCAINAAVPHTPHDGSLEGSVEPLLRRLDGVDDAWIATARRRSLSARARQLDDIGVELRARAAAFSLDGAPNEPASRRKCPRLVCRRDSGRLAPWPSFD